MTDCAEARHLLLDLSRGRLAAAAREPLERHLAGCAPCRAALEAERALDELLRRSVPRDEASADLRRRLGELAVGPGAAAPDRRPRLPRPDRWRRLALPALAAGLLLAAGALLAGRLGEGTRDGAALTEELVNDHLRILAAQHPAEIESGGAHQVKPWFEGRLDFAPVIPTPAVAELELHGGAIGYVLDRRAAVALYTLRRHRVSLLVVPASGLPWSAGPAEAASSRGFRVVRWRAGGLGYALVSDVGAPDLAALAEAFRDATGR